MVYFEKTYPAPSSLDSEFIKNNGSYKEEDVLIKLDDEFHNKCYICESKGLESNNIEHFAPHKDINKIRKFNWSNLFWACSHCNQIKSATEPLLNCLLKEDKVDINIKYYIDDDLATNKIVIEAIDFLQNSSEVMASASQNSGAKAPVPSFARTLMIQNIKTENMVELLIKVYDGTTIQNKFQAREKRNKLYDELCDFTSCIQKYMRTEDLKKKKQLLKSIEYELSNESAFTAFKRWIIRDNQALNQEFQQYIGD
jgi:hypothetical protein